MRGRQGEGDVGHREQAQGGREWGIASRRPPVGVDDKVRTCGKRPCLPLVPSSMPPPGGNSKVDPLYLHLSSTGVASFTSTRRRPARIASCFSRTRRMTSSGSLRSQPCQSASLAPPLAHI